MGAPLSTKPRSVKTIRPGGGEGRLLQRTSVVTSVVILAFIVGYPLAWLIAGSLGVATTGRSQESALRGYYLVFTEFELLRNTALIASSSTGIAVFFGVTIAWIVARTDVPFKRTLSALVLIPFFLTPLIGALGWALLANPSRGALLNRYLMQWFNLQSPPLNAYTPTFIALVMGLYYAPFTYLFVQGALKSMDSSLEEASRVTGGSTRSTMRRVTLPLVSPAILGSTLLIFVLSLGQFAVPAVLGLPVGFEVIPTRIYRSVQGLRPDYATAAAMGVSLMAFSAIGVWAMIRALGKRKFVTVTGKGFRPREIQVGRWKWALLGFVLFYIVVAVVLPIAMLVFASLSAFLTNNPFSTVYTLNNFTTVLFDVPSSRRGIRNSLYLGVVGSFIGAFFSGILAWIIHRSVSRFRRLIEYIIMVPIAVPSTVFALGLLWAWLRFPIGNLYGGLTLLLICYVTIFLPYGVRAVSSTLVQLDVSLEECASVLGASWGRVLRTITVPLLRPGLWAAWVLLFISIIKEISASVLLYSPKSIVLSVSLFGLWEDGMFPRVAALALVQAIIIFVALIVAQRASRSSDFSVY